MIYLVHRYFQFDIGLFRQHVKVFVTTHVVRLKLFRLKAEGVRRARLRRERLPVEDGAAAKRERRKEWKKQLTRGERRVLNPC